MRARRAVLVVAALAAALVGLAAGHRVEQRINDGRYLGSDPAIDALLRAAPTGKRIGLAADWTVAGLTPIWPSFGTRIGNDVEYVGHFVRGFLTPYAHERDFQAALARRRYDLLVVGRGFFPPQADARAALGAGRRLAHDRAQPPPARARRAARSSMSAAIRAVSVSTSRARRPRRAPLAPARTRAAAGVSASAARSAPASAAASPGAASQPHGARTHSGSPTSSLATTRTSIAIASLTTTGIESRSPSRGDDARHREHVGLLQRREHAAPAGRRR